MKEITPQEIRHFRRVIYQYYRKHGRNNLLWRNTDNPYHILVSEIMLQQTQVERVMGKYEQFIAAFPDFSSLSSATLREVLAVWQGMGYNRRAAALKNSAHIVMAEFGGMLPPSVDVLVKLPGIGKTTAAAIAAFAFHQPTVFIETNIRSVFIHFFFKDRDDVRDAEILPLIEKTLDASDPREWYYALMDYGVMLKKYYENPGRRSAHHQKQSPFKDSNRQLRGMILNTMLAHPNISLKEMTGKLDSDPERIEAGLLQLQEEGFVKKKGKGFSIA
jgi:A/G-specific adenine glycosylase